MSVPKFELPFNKITLNSNTFITIGVPNNWEEGVNNCLLIKKEPDYFYHRFCILCSFIQSFTNQILFNWKIISAVVWLVKRYDTLECYDTCGSISKYDGRLKIPEKEWKILKPYKTVLEIVARVTNHKFKYIVMLDIELRTKRAQFHLPEKTIRSENLDFVYACGREKREKDGEQKIYGQWIDITFTRDESRKKWFQPIPKNLSVCCGYCSRRDCRLFRCGRCKEKLYCDKNCQRTHWSEHQSLCKKIF